MATGPWTWRSSRPAALVRREQAGVGQPNGGPRLQKRLDSRRYPTIEGVLEQMEPAGAPGSYKVSGEITSGGHPSARDLMEIRAVDDSTISLSGKSRFDIREFGMDRPGS